jgi:hypothetical protein
MSKNKDVLNLEHKIIEIENKIIKLKNVVNTNKQVNNLKIELLKYQTALEELQFS